MFLILIKTFGAISIFIISIIVGLFHLHKHATNPTRYAGLSEAFASGIFLGAALFHMLPDAEASFHAVSLNTHYPYVNLFCALGFISLLFLERLILHFAKSKAAITYSIIPYALTIILSLHAFIEGTALGINLTIANTAIIFVAILVHKSSESFALANSLTKTPLAMPLLKKIIIAFACMTPIGIMLGSTATQVLTSHTRELTEAIFNAFAAGTFLYIATLHNVTHAYAHEETNYFNEVIATLVGLGSMALIAIWF